MTSSSVQYPLVSRLSSALPLLSAPITSPVSVVPPLHPRKPRQYKLLILSLLVIILSFIGFINYYNVDKTITANDRHYIRLYMPGYAEGCAKKFTYTEQIKVLALAQERVGERTKGWTAIPEGHPREPKEPLRRPNRTMFLTAAGCSKRFTCTWVLKHDICRCLFVSQGCTPGKPYYFTTSKATQYQKYSPKGAG